MHEAAVRLNTKGMLPPRETFPALSATPPSSPPSSLRVDSPPFVPPRSPVSDMSKNFALLRSANALQVLQEGESDLTLAPPDPGPTPLLR